MNYLGLNVVTSSSDQSEHVCSGRQKDGPLGDEFEMFLENKTTLLIPQNQYRISVKTCSKKIS